MGRFRFGGHYSATGWGKEGVEERWCILGTFQMSRAKSLTPKSLVGDTPLDGTAFAGVKRMSTRLVPFHARSYSSLELISTEEATDEYTLFSSKTPCLHEVTASGLEDSDDA